MIKLCDVSKSYSIGSTSLNVLHKINLEVKEGEKIAVTGPSGSGKSTLLHILGALDNFDSGKYEFQNQDVGSLTSKEKSYLRLHSFGFVFQSYHLLSTLTAYENIVLPLLAAKQDINLQEFNDTIELLNLQNRLTHFPKQMSGGEQQRVAIARAVLNRPKVIFADEPTGNLDEENSINVMELLEECCARYNQTLIFVTHDVSLTRYADRIIELNKGK